ncbi:MAG: transposase [Cytophagales bacterium]|nr:MAG: transposase [Cytophagales bacterium]
MKASKFSEGQIVAILKSQTADKTVEQICREHGIALAIFYAWKKKYRGMESEEIKRMRDLEAENARLKKILADKSLDYDILKEGYERLKKA